MRLTIVSPSPLPSAVTDAPWPLLRKPYSADALARAIARALDPESQAA